MRSSLNTHEMRSGYLPGRIIHLHPSRLCNLTCLHCYSSSSPKNKTLLDLNSIERILPLLKDEGYKIISISGGEPLTYKPLIELIDIAQSIGFRVTMITNGIFPIEQINKISSKLNGIAISFDGLSDTHNYIRGRSDAFLRASTALANIAERGTPVGAAISLARETIPELPELAEHLAKLGANSLQIRPIALAGRAQNMNDLNTCNDEDRTRLYLVTLALQEEFSNRIQVQCHLIPSQYIWQSRTAYNSLLNWDGYSTSKDQVLSDLVNPLVITETGRIKPITYDFNPRFDIASIDALTYMKIDLYKKKHVHDYKRLIQKALIQLKNKNKLIDWFDYCTRLSGTYEISN